jgi:hypothetical protein
MDKMIPILISAFLCSTVAQNSNIANNSSLNTVSSITTFRNAHFSDVNKISMNSSSQSGIVSCKSDFTILAGVRTKEEVLLSVARYMHFFKKINKNYSKSNPKFQGNLVVQFLIDSNGDIIKCKTVNSDGVLPIYEKEILCQLTNVKFSKMDISDLTEVVYPLLFSKNKEEHVEIVSIGR